MGRGLSESNQNTPQVLSQTMLGKALWDFDRMLSADPPAAFFSGYAAIKEMSEEQKDLIKKCNLLYILTFIGACVIFLGPFPESAKIEFLNIDLPLNLIPQQLISIVMAAMYGQFCIFFASLITIMFMIARILSGEGIPVWQFFFSRFDSSMLWTALIVPRVFEYSSPKIHLIIGKVILLISLSIIIMHGCVVISSSIISLTSALNSGVWYLILFSSVSTITVCFSVLILISSLFLKMKFRSVD